MGKGVPKKVMLGLGLQEYAQVHSADKDEEKSSQGKGTVCKGREV